MRAVKQTVLGPKGNCMSACLASILELPIDAVPNFFDSGQTDQEWNDALTSWLRTHGLAIITLVATPEVLEKTKGNVIVSGPSLRGLTHATVWREGEMIWDPHPDDTGLIEPKEVDIIYPIDLAVLNLKQYL